MAEVDNPDGTRAPEPHTSADGPPWEGVENAVNEAINAMRRAQDHRAGDDNLEDEDDPALRKYRELATRMRDASRQFHAVMHSDERPERASTSGPHPGMSSRHNWDRDDHTGAPRGTMQTTQGPVASSANPAKADPKK